MLSLKGSRSRSKRRAQQQSNGQDSEVSSKDTKKPPASFVEEHKDPNAREDDDEVGGSIEYAHHHDHNALIYSAPTVDSLGDESALIHPYANARSHLSRPPMDIPASASLLRTPTSSIPSIPTATSRSITPLRHNISTKAQNSSAGTPQRSSHRHPSPASTPLHRSNIPSSPATGGVPSPMPTPSAYNRSPHPHSSSPSVNRSGSGSGSASLKSKKGSSISSSKRVIDHHATTHKKQYRKTKTSKKDRDFQHQEDAMHVSVRTISVAERSAFNLLPAPSVEEWQQKASNGMGKKLSPSLQHLQLLHKMQSITQVRQLAFSPSVGLASDIFYPWDGGDDQNTGTANATKKRRNEKRDGRYRSIDPVLATVAALPSTPPMLSNKKNRLPLRSDVGFPNASMEEIMAKQKEIAHETEWEEASPRLVVLVTSDDLGTAVQDNSIDNGKEQQPPKRLSPKVIVVSSNHPSASSGLEGMTWAGPELQMAIERNRRHFSRNNKNGRSQKDGNNRDKKKQFFFVPNKMSVLAPPLDATFSNSLGWRPRPFHDRSPGMAYALACPVQVDFDVGDIEPLLCSLSLYHLPILPTQDDDSEESPSTRDALQPPFGKISEDFWFPAGDWKGRINLDEARNSQTNKMDPDLVESWLGRKHKALFSYDPLVLFPNKSTSVTSGSANDAIAASAVDRVDGRDTLYVVLQVYKVTHLESAAAYLANLPNNTTSNNPNNNAGSGSLRKRLQKHLKMGVADSSSSSIISDSKSDRGHASFHLDEAVHQTNHRANLVFESFNTQFMTPLCYGVTNLFSPSETLKAKSEKVTWPKGETQSIPMFCVPSKSESQEEFCERLVITVAHLTSASPLSSLQAHLRNPSELTVLSDQNSTISGAESISSHQHREDSQHSTRSSQSFSSPTKRSKRSGVRRFISPRRPSAREREVLVPSTSSLSASSQFATRRQSPTPKASTSRQAVSTASSTGSSRLSSTIQSNKTTDDLQPIAASVRLFTSTLDVDFLQSMLFSPPEIENATSAPDNITNAKGESNSRRQLPKLLVDTSGDSAIMMDPKRDPIPAKITSGAHSTATIPRKRSTLVRLPKTLKQAAYVEASEIREVLFLRPRSDKSSYDIDVPPSYRSLLNLLYLYPRLLRLEEDNSGVDNTRRKGQRYSIRIRLVRSPSSSSIDQTTENLQALHQFHNPAPWAGPHLLNAVYTKIPSDFMSGKLPVENSADDLKVGIPMRDEFKLRLPMILDGTYFLQFTLLAVDIEDSSAADVSKRSSIKRPGGIEDGCGISFYALAQSTIPLSSSSRSGGGIKATTIIPNGCHRLKLGDFQLQLETRLVSSIHVADTAVAAALRDFPYANSATKLGKSDQNVMVISRQSSRDAPSSFPEKVSYSSLFSSTSGSALVGHFQPLLFMHLSNLVALRDSNDGTINHIDSNATGKMIVENMQSLLEIFRRIKLDLLSTNTQGCSGGGERRVEAFVKASIDAFDESLLNSASSNTKQDSEEDEASEVVPLEHTRSNSNSVAISQSESGDEDHEDEFDGGAIRKRNKDTLRSELDLRISRTFSAMGESSGIPFSRVAYGASKTDRMKLEAELDTEDNGRLTHLVDDDETVVTVATSFAEARMAEARAMLAGKSIQESTENEDVKDTMEESYVNSIESETQSHSDWREYGSYSKSIAEMAIAKRVKSAAQVMLAPCVTPNLSSVFAAVRNSPTRCSAEASSFKDETPETVATPSISKTDQEKSQIANAHALVSPGSEIEEEAPPWQDDKDDILMYSHGHESMFRSPSNCPVLTFSIQQNPEYNQINFPLARGEFLYETILVLWLRAWLEHVERKNEKGTVSGSTGRPSPTVLIPKLDFECRFDDTMYSFYANMDAILPLCLKSIILRYGQAVSRFKSKSARVILDDDHMTILEPFVEMLARGLMGEALAGSNSTACDRGLMRALRSLEVVLEFLVGLFAVLHPAHMAVLISKYFKTLRDCETEHLDTADGDLVFAWTEESLHRVKCSRQLRIRAVEKFAVLPNFIALNYPLRYSSVPSSGKFQEATWKQQYNDVKQDDGLSLDGSIHGEDEDLLPHSGWLADLLTSESLSICALSCEAVVAEAMAHMETQPNHDPARNSPAKTSSLKKRPTASLKRSDLLMFQSVAIHAITCVYELLLRRHAMDKRFQTEKSRGRIAALFAKPIFEKSLASVRWLARMEATHKVRSLWLLCFVYVLQEAPEVLIREAVRDYCNPQDVLIHRFIRLLRLSSSTFQSFIDQPRHSMFPSEIDIGISPWLLQESFNTICATTIIVVEESVGPTSTFPRDRKKMIQGILDLLLHVLTTPQSCVTHLRAVGGAIQALEKFGPDMFLEIAGGSLQHWIRVVLSLMNSIALSVRSIAVDFVVSILGSVFDVFGNIDELALIFITVLPEVVAREIALYSVSGHIHNLDDVEKSIWPLRRSFADVEDTNPLDDNRVDPQLSPFLSVFCRACQAVIDGVLIEMRLQGSDCVVIGTRMEARTSKVDTFDADEESLFEAANFFAPETAPMQRIRWLMTLKSLHEAKGQWVEAAETLIMCARTISDSIPHLRHVWRPSRFVLWSDSRRSLWLSTVGEEMGNPERGNEQVMNFADNFLEPGNIVGSAGKASAAGKLPQPTVPAMCNMLTNITKEAVTLYLREDGTDELAYTRLESLLKILMGVLDDHGSMNLDAGSSRLGGLMERKRYVEEEAALRRVLAKLSGDMTKLAERLLLIVQDEPTSPTAETNHNQRISTDARRPYYVRVLLSGKKPARFKESTTIPTFLEWNAPCICRVPRNMVETSLSRVSNDPSCLEDVMCAEFGKPILEALDQDGDIGRIAFRTGLNALPGLSPEDTSTVNIDISFIEMNDSGINKIVRDDGSLWNQSKHFFYRKPNDSDVSNGKSSRMSDVASTFVEVRVAYPFPCALSRQRTLLTSEFLPTG